MSRINDKTADGLFDFCDFMVDKGYATSGATDPWKTATRKVLGTVYDDDFGSTDLADIDLDDVMSRFETLTRGQYKHESVQAYGRRIRNAIDAYMEFLDTGKPPQLRRASRPAGPKSEKKPPEKQTEKRAAVPQDKESGDLIQFPFPLRDGAMAQLHLPRRLQKDDADRLSAFLRTLQVETQKELPERTGEEAQAA